MVSRQHNREWFSIIDGSRPNCSGMGKRLCGTRANCLTEGSHIATR